MKNAKKLNEQMIRIKSLFTEERLWGNIINEACDSEQEAADYLEKAGYVVSAPGNSATQKARRDLINCLEQPNIKKLYDQIKDHENKVKIEISDRSGIGCVLLISSKDKNIDWISITIQDKKLLVYYVFAENLSFSDYIGVTLPSNPTFAINKYIKYIGYEGDYDKSSGGYTNLKYKELFDTAGNTIRGTGTTVVGKRTVPKYRNDSGDKIMFKEILFGNTSIKLSGSLNELVGTGIRNEGIFIRI